MIKEAIFHKADSNFCYLTDSRNMVIVVKAAKGDLSNVLLLYDVRYDKSPKLDLVHVPLKLAMSDELYDYFRVEFSCLYHRMSYFFSLTDNKGNHSYFNQEGISEDYSWGRHRLFQMPYLHEQDAPQVPKWLKESIMYQIFPDSYANGKESIEEKPVSHIVKDNIKVESRFGGTLRGIIENIPYIKDLGITLIYLNPIFTAKSYHKYDEIDYFEVDPCLGTREDLKELVNQCHENGIRIMLDLVINQSSNEFFAFRDVLKEQENSAYVDWYHIHSFPVQMGKSPNYETFSFYDVMPKFNTENEEVKEYLLDIGRYWVKEFDIDGYRLDVANELPHDFWRCFRSEMDKLKSDFALIGEVWHDADSWIGRDQFHSVMNYPLMMAVWEFFGLDSKNAIQFGQTISRLTMKYPLDNTQAMMNFLDSHDVERFLSLSKVNYKRQKLAAAFIMTYVGMPSVYYGDEKAIEGLDIYDSRRKMIWKDDENSSSMYEFYKKIIHIRRENPVLVYGEYKLLLADAVTNQFGFLRGDKEEHVICIFNNSSSQQETRLRVEGDAYVDLMTDEHFHQNENTLTVRMQPFGARILKKS
jgi:glycosidase